MQTLNPSPFPVVKRAENATFVTFYYSQPSNNATSAGPLCARLTEKEEVDMSKEQYEDYVQKRAEFEW